MLFRAAVNLSRRVIIASSLLVLTICGAEVGVRTYEAATGCAVYQTTDGTCGDPSKLTVPSWSCHQELKPCATSTVECKDSKTIIEIQINSRGLRGVEPVVPKPPNLCRIVVLGDETIFAPETAESEHFCALLQNQLQQQSRVPIEVINAGVPGHCPLTEFVFFKQRLMALQPDLVLLHFDWSDVADDRHMRRFVRSDASGPQSCPNAKLAEPKKNRQHEVWRRQFRLFDWALSSLTFEWKQQIARQSAASRDVDSNSYAWLRDEHPEDNLSFRHSVEPIVYFSRLCKSSNCQFVMFTSPKPWQVSPKCSRGEGVRLAAGVARDACYLNRAPFDVLARFASRQQIPLIDGSIVISPGQDAEANFLQHAPRWSPTGHKRMADYVARFLIERAPGTWSSPYFPQNERPISNARPQSSVIQWTSGQQPISNRPVANRPVTGLNR